MASLNRTAVLTKFHKVLKKHYQPQPVPSGRSLLENLLLACCLENAPYAAAEQAYRALSDGFFDWNEVRVSTVKELSEVMKGLPDSAASAERLKRALQGAFEATYSFDLESFKKLNLGQAVQKLEKFGCSPFVVGYLVQTSLGGHSIPLDAGAMGVLAVVGVVDENAVPSSGCPGLERAIAKNKGWEFGSLLHQIAAEFIANPFSTKLHAVLLEVDPEAKSRLPKRQSKPVKKEAPAPAKAVKPEAKGKPATEAKPSEKKPEASAKKATAASAGAKKPAPAAAKKTSAKKPAVRPSVTTLAKRKPR